MTINHRFLAEDLHRLVPDSGGSDDQLMTTFKNGDTQKISETVGAIAKELRVRLSTLPFSEAHEAGQDKPGRHLGICTKYLDQISKAVASGDSGFSSDELGWHAFGAAVCVVAGILDHLQEQDYNP